MRPLVSIIISTYNWSNVLPYSIGSALRQTFTDFEVLVIGDGCTDDSESVVKSIGDDRVRWINLPANTGHQSGPNNEGLRRTRGDYVAYLGHDDLWLPHHLSCLMAALSSGADLAYGLTEVIGPNDSYRASVPRTPQYVPGAWIPPTAVAHRRRMTERVGGWRHYRELAVDPEVDLWHRAYDAGHKFAFVPRLTAIKFPAADRPGSYKQKPNHEQAAWFERIHNERDLEAVELGRLLVSTQAAGTWRDMRYRHILRVLLRETAARTRDKLARVIGRTHTPAKGAGVDAHRLRKGLEPMR